MSIAVNIVQISLASNTSKIIEKLKQSCLMKYYMKYFMKISLVLDVIILCMIHANSEITKRIKAILWIGKLWGIPWLKEDFWHCNILRNMLLKKLEYYGIKDITKNCFHSYLIDRMEYTTLYQVQCTISSKRYEKKVQFTRPLPLEEQCCWFCYCAAMGYILQF